MQLRPVSILLVLEIGLDAGDAKAIESLPLGFNPSCAGNWLRRGSLDIAEQMRLVSFNPSCAGNWLRRKRNRINDLLRYFVSILLVLEIGLDDSLQACRILGILSFNPSCAGNWLRRIFSGIYYVIGQHVSILLVLEIGLDAF